MLVGIKVNDIYYKMPVTTTFSIENLSHFVKQFINKEIVGKEKSVIIIIIIINII